MKFCFFGNISGALNGETPGGGELQIALLAKALALNGHEIVIIDPYAKKSFITSEGVKLINIPDWNKGIAGVRLFIKRIPVLRKMFIEQNADYYYVRMRTYLHLIPYKVAKRNHGKFIQAIASESDLFNFRNKYKFQYKANFNLFRFIFTDLPNDLVFNFLIRNSDYVILQHPDQHLIQNKVRGNVKIFPNIFKFPTYTESKESSKDYFIHVGALNTQKGVENLYQLLQLLDNKVKIVIIGLPTDEKSKKIVDKIKEFENVIFKGRLKHNQTMQLIADAKALINTSNYEGFPNIFLEAWASGVPVISLKINPGNIINKYELGKFCDGNFKIMKEFIESHESQNYKKEKLIGYVSEFHDFSTAGDRFLDLLQIN